jgi:hypothetical protein
MSKANRRQVQEALHRLDYYKGPVDGIFGRLTRAAIRRFQHEIGATLLVISVRKRPTAWLLGDTIDHGRMSSGDPKMARTSGSPMSWSGR